MHLQQENRNSAVLGRKTSVTEAFTLRGCRMRSNYLFLQLSFPFLFIHSFIHFNWSGENKSQIPIPGQVIYGVFRGGNWGRRDDGRQVKRVRIRRKGTEKWASWERSNRNLRRCGSLMWLLLKNLRPEETECDSRYLRCVRERLLFLWWLISIVHMWTSMRIRFAWEMSDWLLNIRCWTG